MAQTQLNPEVLNALKAGGDAFNQAQGVDAQGRVDAAVKAVLDQLGDQLSPEELADIQAQAKAVFSMVSMMDQSGTGGDSQAFAVEAFKAATEVYNSVKSSGVGEPVESAVRAAVEVAKGYGADAGQSDDIETATRLMFTSFDSGQGDLPEPVALVQGVTGVTLSQNLDPINEPLQDIAEERGEDNPVGGSDDFQDNDGGGINDQAGDFNFSQVLADLQGEGDNEEQDLLPPPVRDLDEDAPYGDLPEKPIQDFTDFGPSGEDDKEKDQDDGDDDPLPDPIEDDGDDDPLPDPTGDDEDDGTAGDTGDNGDGGDSGDSGDGDGGDTPPPYDGPKVFDLGSLESDQGSTIKTGDFKGTWVSASGDVNGDGKADILIGSGTIGARDDVDAVALITENPLESVNSVDDVSGSDSGAYYTTANPLNVSILGDINGDGYNDYAIADRASNGSGRPDGSVFVFYGKEGTTFDDLSLSRATQMEDQGFMIKAGSDDNFASGLHSLGDVNGDGFDDFMISSGKSSARDTAYGSSWVVFGKSGDMADIDLYASSNDLGANGFRITNADGDIYKEMNGIGDINSDGFNDFAVSTNKSGTSVIFGSASLGADMDFGSINADTGFEISSAPVRVTNVGDINGDGYDDLAYSTMYKTNVIFGKESGLSTTDLHTMEFSDGTAGFSINNVNAVTFSGKVDVNGDGYDDIVFVDSDSSAREVQTYVIYGKSEWSSLSATDLKDGDGLILNHKTPWTLDYSISSGDVNGDGFGDVVISDFYDRFMAEPATGDVTVFYGKNFENASTEGVTKTGTSEGEILVGGIGNDVLTGEGGRDVLLGGAGDDILSISETNFIKLDGDGGSDTLSLAGNGITLDLTNPAVSGNIDGIETINLAGDGNNQVVMSAETISQILGDEGQGTLTIKGDGSYTFSDEGWTQGVDTDGFTDFTKGGLTVKIQTDLVPVGPKSVITTDMLDGTNGFYIKCSEDTHDFGSSISIGGDINGDGLSDIIISAPAYAGDSGLTNPGGAFVINEITGDEIIYTNTAINSDSGIFIEGVDDNGYAGAKLDIVGDINGDGYDDFALTHAKYGERGRAYVFFGGESATTSDLQLNNFAADDAVGFHVTGGGGNGFPGDVVGIGDVNGDGYDDIAISEQYYNSDNGATWVVFGKESGFQNLDLFMLSNDLTTFGHGFRVDSHHADDKFGCKVSAAGDVNGDGIDDMFVTSDTYNATAYVVYGSKSIGDNNQSVNNRFGYEITGFDDYAFSNNCSISTAGDINGDGYDDVMITTSYVNNADNSEGSTFVVFGGKAANNLSLSDTTSLNGTNGFRINGNVDSQYHGYKAVAGGGDFNGDGYDDIFIHSINNDETTDGIDFKGEVKVIFGKEDWSVGENGFDISDLDGSNGFTLRSSEYDGLDFGLDISCAGDVNGDGYDDLAITDSAQDRVFVFFGNNHNGLSTDPVNQTGDAGNNIIVGGLGNDMLSGGGGVDVLRGGAGNDTLTVADLNFLKIDGGGGKDVLEFDMAESVINLASTSTLGEDSMFGKIDDIEAISTSGTDNVFFIDAQSVSQMLSDEAAGTLKISADNGGFYSFNDAVDWSNDGNVDGYNVFSNEGITVAIQDTIDPFAT